MSDLVEAIEAKIKTHVISLLDKDDICYYDYLVLVGELGRQHTKDEEERLKAENKAQQEQWLSTLTSMIAAKK